MRILHAAKRYPNSLAGDSIMVLNLQKQQRQAGHEVFIMTSNCPIINAGPGVKKFGLPISSEAIDVINLRRVITIAWLIPWAFWYLRRIRPDVIHSHTMDFGFGLSFAARLYHIPMVNTCHGVSFTDPDLPRAKRTLELRLLRAGHFNEIITVDETSLPAFKQLGFRNVRYLPNAIDLDRFTVAKPYSSGRFELFYVGRLSAMKGIPQLIEALPALKGDWRLRMTGLGFDDEVAEYKRRLAELGLTKQVKFLGMVPPIENARIFTDSHAFVLPSLHEGFPTVLLEAWAVGIPAIMTKVGTMTTACTDEVDTLMVGAGSSEQLSAAINRVMTDGALRAKLGRNGRKLVESRYSFVVLAKNIEQLYHDMLTPTRPNKALEQGKATK